MLYDYECTNCGKVWTKNISLARREEPINEPCPECNESGHIRQVILGAPSIGDGVRLGIRRPDGGMKEVLQKIHEKTAGSKLTSNSQLTRL